MGCGVPVGFISLSDITATISLSSNQPDDDAQTSVGLQCGDASHVEEKQEISYSGKAVISAPSAAVIPSMEHAAPTEPAEPAPSAAVRPQQPVKPAKKSDVQKKQLNKMRSPPAGLPPSG